jgi:HD superfamily phosphohydrolase
MKPYISFPGTYEKDRRVREIIGLLWQYLAYRVSSVITIGIGGLWDPIVVAFLSDLANERDLPFVDINISTESSYLRKEIIIPDTSGKRFLLNKPANEFMDVLSQLIDQNIDDIQKRPMIEVVYARDNLGEDKFWDKILKKWELSDFEKRLIMNPLVEISSRFAQLGLKSKWWGVSNEYRWHHNRLNHSKGVMKIASLLYEKACENSNRQKNELEKQFLRIAALLHDIGHLPFSHLIEEVFQELNWKPGGYAESFSHDYYTAEKVRKIFQDETLNTELNKIGYSIEDLIKLINGEYGIGFLDAIINGPIDADKIDYIFRDVELTNVITHLVEPKKVLDDIGRQISISPTGLLVLKGDSALASFTILDQRERLYKNLYLSKPIRLMEKALKFIIITYFVHTFNTIEINTLEISENIRNKFLENEKQLSDLGGIRIAMASEELESLSEKFKAEDDIEMKIVNHMKSVLDKKPINISVKRAINECFSLIEGVNGEKVCKDEAEKRFKKLSNNKFSREREEKFRYDAKTTILRYPGAVLIDVLPPFEYFKIAGGRKPKARSDGTNKESECILWDDSIEIRKRIQEKIKHEQGEINVYRIGENSEVDRAIGLIEKLLGEERKLEEVE